MVEKDLGSAASDVVLGIADSEEELGSDDSEWVVEKDMGVVGIADSEKELDSVGVVGIAHSEEEPADSEDLGFVACHQLLHQPLTVEICPLQHLDHPRPQDKHLLHQDAADIQI